MTYNLFFSFAKIDDNLSILVLCCVNGEVVISKNVSSYLPSTFTLNRPEGLATIGIIIIVNNFTDLVIVRNV